MVPLPASTDLDRRLAALKESVADALPPPAVDRAVAAAVARAAQRSAPRPVRRSAGDRWLAWPLALADIERAGDAMVVPARLPRMTLAQLGLPVNPALAADAIDTELLVRRDGSVLAVRFIY